MSEQAPQKLWRLSVKCKRVISVLPQQKVKTVMDEWVLCDLPGPSPLFARNGYWKHLPHRCPAMLNRKGEPTQVRRLKIGEIIVREKLPTDAELPEARELREAVGATITARNAPARPVIEEDAPVDDPDAERAVIPPSLARAVSAALEKKA